MSAACHKCRDTAIGYYNRRWWWYSYVCRGIVRGMTAIGLTFTMPPATLRRFHAKYRVSSRTGCWVWLASRSRGGYGRFHVRAAGTDIAHRIAYAHFAGPIPPLMTVDHLCKNRACVNPAHMELVSAVENVKRADKTNVGRHNREKTHCVRGHEFNAENTIYRSYIAGGERWRACRECRRQYKRRARRRKADGGPTVLCSPPILLDRLHEKDMRDKATARRLRRAS